QLLARPQREVDGREARRRGDRRLEGRGQCGQEEGRHAPHGGREQGVRALSLVVGAPLAVTCCPAWPSTAERGFAFRSAASDGPCRWRITARGAAGGQTKVTQKVRPRLR